VLNTETQNISKKKSYPMFAFNFKEWINTHRDKLKPPVGNVQIWEDREFMVTVVGGPNSRQDYHINEGEEFFFQLEGDVYLKIIDEEGNFKNLPIKEGEIFLLPPNVPHSPQRPAGTVGLVIERKRLAHELDGLVWYCQNCNEKLYEEFFHLKDITKDLQPVFQKFFSTDEFCVCKKCGTKAIKGSVAQ
jgi:3-hydroxyanthranilate 3,4-dioxygenase